MIDFVFEKGLKAFECDNDPPIRGDLRPLVDYPPGTKLSEVTQFEVFDGRDWLKPDDQVFLVQL